MLISDHRLISQDQAFALLDQIMQQSEAEDVFVQLLTGTQALTRYSENQITQNLSQTRVQLKITSYFGTRSASSTTTDLSSEAITDTLRRAETLANIAPENPEWVPLLTQQTYEERTPTFDLATVNFSPQERGKQVQAICHLSQGAGVNGAGTLSTDATMLAIANSQGVKAYNCTTTADFSFTARVDDGSSWTERTAWGIAELPISQLAEQVITRAYESRHPQEIQPGQYDVVFEGAAFASLLEWLIWNLDARFADEGCSFMSRTDAQGNPDGNYLGEPLFSPLVQVRRDPGHPLLQTLTFFEDGLPNTALEIITDGIPQTLAYSRYWAAKQGKAPTGQLSPFVMSGSDQSVADLIAQTERGIFVSRAWYVGYVNPKTLELTGMTRDGTFWIENGKIAYPIRNLRFNQSVPELLKNVEAVSASQRYGRSVVPGVKVKSFRFSSVTDSV